MAWTFRCSFQLALWLLFLDQTTTQVFIHRRLASLRFLLNMADVDTAIAMPARRGSTRLTRQGIFFDVTMSKKRLDRVVPIIAIHETAPPAQDVGDSSLARDTSTS